MRGAEPRGRARGPPRSPRPGGAPRPRQSPPLPPGSAPIAAPARLGRAGASRDLVLPTRCPYSVSILQKFGFTADALPFRRKRKRGREAWRPPRSGVPGRGRPRPAAGPGTAGSGFARGGHQRAPASCGIPAERGAQPGRGHPESAQGPPLQPRARRGRAGACVSLPGQSCSVCPRPELPEATKNPVGWLCDLGTGAGPPCAWVSHLWTESAHRQCTQGFREPPGGPADGLAPSRHKRQPTNCLVTGF